MHKHVHAHVHQQTQASTCMHACMHACMYIQTCINMHTSVYAFMNCEDVVHNIEQIRILCNNCNRRHWNGLTIELVQPCIE